MFIIYLTASGIFEVRLYQERDMIKSVVTHTIKKITVSSFVIGLEISRFFFHSSSSETILQRFFQVDHDSQRVAYVGGLQGGGGLCSKDPTSHIDQLIIEKNKITQCNSVTNIIESIQEIRISQQGQNNRFKSNVYSPNKIIGRESEVNQIHNAFRKHNLVALKGKAGIGKTSTAIKYAQEHISSFKLVWKINSESTGTILLDFALLAKEIGLSTCNPKDIVKELDSQLHGPDELVLLIFDGALCFDQIEEYYIDNQNLKFLITSKARKWSSKILIQQLPDEISIKLLQERLGIDRELEEISELAEELGHWPIAIEQSIGAIKKNSFNIRYFTKIVKNGQYQKEKIKIILSTQFLDISKQTLTIIEILSVCDSKKIPECMIKELFIDYFPEDDFLNSKKDLLNHYIISTEGEFWNVHKVVHKYIHANCFMKDKERIIKYYCKEFIIAKNMEIDKILKIMHLRPHIERLVNYIPINTIKEMQLFNYLIKWYLKNHEVLCLSSIFNSFLFEGYSIARLSSTLTAE